MLHARRCTAWQRSAVCRPGSRCRYRCRGWSRRCSPEWHTAVVREHHHHGCQLVRDAVQDKSRQLSVGGLPAQRTPPRRRKAWRPGRRTRGAATLPEGWPAAGQQTDAGQAGRVRPPACRHTRAEQGLDVQRKTRAAHWQIVSQIIDGWASRVQPALPKPLPTHLAWTCTWVMTRTRRDVRGCMPSREKPRRGGALISVVRMAMPSSARPAGCQVGRTTCTKAERHRRRCLCCQLSASRRQLKHSPGSAALRAAFQAVSRCGWLKAAWVVPNRRRVNWSEGALPAAGATAPPAGDTCDSWKRGAVV